MDNIPLFVLEHEEKLRNTRRPERYYGRFSCSQVQYRYWIFRLICQSLYNTSNFNKNIKIILNTTYLWNSSNTVLELTESKILSKGVCRTIEHLLFIILLFQLHFTLPRLNWFRWSEFFWARDQNVKFWISNGFGLQTVIHTNYISISPKIPFFKSICSTIIKWTEISANSLERIVGKVLHCVVNQFTVFSYNFVSSNLSLLHL